MIANPGTIVFPLNAYPTSDGKPMAETDFHRDLMLALIETLKWYFEADPDVYVSGNLLVFYEKGNKRRHVSPDVFVVRGVRKGLRPNYLLWEEKYPDVVMEITSKTTRREDIDKKWKLYESKLKVKEYFLFDPYEDYLTPSFQGYRRVRGQFKAMTSQQGRFFSTYLGLELERDGLQLRLRDPQTGKRLPTPAERAEAEAERAEAEAERAEAEAERAEAERMRAQHAEKEVERLRRELNALKKRFFNGA